MCVLSRFSRIQLFETPPDSSVHGILQARILGWIATPSSRDQTHVSSVSCIGTWVLYRPPGRFLKFSVLAAAAAAKSLQSCPTLFD